MAGQVNRRSLIALGIASALARFFPMPDPPAFVEVEADDGHVTITLPVSEDVPLCGLGELVTWGEQRSIGRIIQRERRGDAIHVTMAMDDGRMIEADIGRWP